MTTRNPQRGNNPKKLINQATKQKQKKPKTITPLFFSPIPPLLLPPTRKQDHATQRPPPATEPFEEPPRTPIQLKPHIINSSENKGAASSPGPLIPPIQPPFFVSLSICSFCPGGQGFSGFPQTRVPRCKPPLRNPPPLTRHRSACFNTEPLPATPSQPPPISEAAAPPTQPQPTLERAHHKSPTHSHPPTIHKVT